MAVIQSALLCALRRGCELALWRWDDGFFLGSVVVVAEVEKRQVNWRKQEMKIRNGKERKST